MLDKDHLLEIPYKYTANPLDVDQLTYPVGEANCLRAAQLFCFRKLGIPLSPFEAMAQEGYLGTGQLVAEYRTGEEEIFYKSLQFGDIIYAVMGGNRVVEERYNPKKLHIAVFAGTQKDPLLYHGSYQAGQTTLTAINSFLQNYTPVRARRIIDESGSRLPNQFIPHPF